jgi:hypothetical protein
MRKEADLHIADRIRLDIKGAEAIVAVHGPYICAETLCVELAPQLERALVERSVGIEGGQVTIRLERATAQA